MLATATAQHAWLEMIRQLLKYHVQSSIATPGLIAGSLVVIAAGLFLVFRGGKFERFIVCAFALCLGGYLGSRAADLTNWPGPITIAVGAILIAFLAYKTYRLWLAAGSVLVVFMLAITFQLGRTDLQANLEKIITSAGQLESGTVELREPAEQEANLASEAGPLLEKVRGAVLNEIKDIGPTGWIIPVAAAIVGGVLAYWMLRAFAILWLGFFGANMAIIGAAVALCACITPLRDILFLHPGYPAAAAIGLWLTGLIVQARDARLPPKPKAEGDSDDSKS